MQKFSELPYTRPDIAAAVEEYKRYSEAFKAAKTFEEAKKVFLDAEKLDTHLSTIASLCSIRNTMNTTDEFYEAEMAYLNEKSAEPDPGGEGDEGRHCERPVPCGL